MIRNRLMYPLDRMAAAIGFSRSGIQKFLNRKPSKRDAADSHLKLEVLSIFKESRCTYGAPRLLQKLRQKSIPCGTGRIQKLQKILQIQGSSRRRKKLQTTDSAHDQPISPNLFQRNFRATRTNGTWVSDITYLRTAQGWLYLCIFLDLFSRKIVGRWLLAQRAERWSMSDNLDAVNTCNALKMAIGRRGPQEGLIIHSDRGVQYASEEFRDLISENNFRQSMSRKADCLDNAVAESFFGTLKSELSANVFGSHAEARREVFDYIECFYNTVRIHSYLGYKSPLEFEQNEAA